MKPFAALGRWVARVRSLPARAERIDTTLPHVLDTIRHVDELVKDAAHERPLAAAALTTELTASVAAVAQRVASVEQALAGLHHEVRQVSDYAQMGRIELDRAATELGRVVPEIREFRAEAIVHQRELRAYFGPVHHDAKVGFEASVGQQRDGALGNLLATLAVPAERRPGLSVIMITWNHAGFLADALASAFNALAALEPADRGEVLVLDDGSTDETGDVLAPYVHDGRVRLINSPRNLGLWRARNALLAVCPTTHAVILDADNWLLPDGVRAIYETARTYRSTITYGQVIASTSGGTDWSAFAYAPSAESLRTGQSFDSMAVIDVDAVLHLGGYSGDPGLAGVADDFELILRCLRRRHLVGYVPAVLGHYRITPLRHSAEVPDMRGVNARVQRSYLYDNPDFDSFPLFGAHPDTGVLWATTAARSRVGDRATTRPPAPTANAAGPSVLLIVSGGVGNLGDDAISDGVLRRLREAHPNARIELVSDRELPVVTGAPVPWSGTVMELWQGLTDDELAAAADAGNGYTTVAALTPGRRNAPLLDLASFDAAYVAGGGFLASPFAERLLRPRVAVALALAAAGVPVVWSGQGIGPCTDDELSLVAAAASAARAFGCRDAGSIECLPSELRAAATLVGDDAIGITPSPVGTVRAALERAHVVTERFVVLHVRNAEYLGDAHLAALADAVDAIAHGIGATVVGLAINDNHPSEASVFAELSRRSPRLAPWRLLDTRRSPALAMGALAQADAVVSHSYHLALWALAAGTPTLLGAQSTYYAQKARGLAVLAGVEGGIALPEVVDADTIRACLDRISGPSSMQALAAAAERVNDWWNAQLVTVPSIAG